MSKLLFTADFHIRSDIPRCRVDDFLEVQKNTVKQIFDIARKNEAKVIIAGDIFHKAKPENAQELEIMLGTYSHNAEVYFLAGNHDLLYHKTDNFYKSSIGVLDNFRNWEHFQESSDPFIRFFDYGVEILDCDYEDFSMAVLHKYIAEKELPFFIKDGLTAKELCESYDYKIFVTGDSHHGFVYYHSKTGQIVINPGCITRQESTFKKYKPRVYLYDTESNEVERIDLLDTDISVVVKIDQEKAEDRENRIDSFIEKLKNTNGFDLSFEKNIAVYCKQNKISSDVEEEILKTF